MNRVQAVLVLVVFGGCTFREPVQLREHGLGRFEFRKPAKDMAGVIIGAPHADSESGSDRLARAISDRTGAGLAVAYGFKSRRLSVTQPIVESTSYADLSHGSIQRASVFAEYRRILFQEVTNGRLNLYIGVHRTSQKKLGAIIEVATSGLTFEQARALKRAYKTIRDRLIQGTDAPALDMAIEPLDVISWRVSGVKHHGVLLYAEKGLNLRIPQLLQPDGAEGFYTEVLSQWAEDAVRLLRDNPLHLSQIRVKLMKLGRFELVKPADSIPGVALGAPHGSFDEYTAELVKRVSCRTGIAAVIAKGFTPTETGGPRINVNRPTEKIPYSEGREVHNQRAKDIYGEFRDLVLQASSMDLRLYIDIHQYGRGSDIQVATVGISRRQARVIKMLYYYIREQVLTGQHSVPAVELVIEPLEVIEIGAWAAKADGILSLAGKSMHFEIPSQIAFATADARKTYTRIVAALLKETVPFLMTGVDTGLRGSGFCGEQKN
jgi:hypothetical protein